MTPEQAAVEYSVAVWVGGKERYACCFGKSEKIQNKVDAAKAGIAKAVSNGSVKSDEPYEVDVSSDALDDWETVLVSIFRP